MNCFGLGAGGGAAAGVGKQTRFSLFSWPNPRQEQSCGASRSQHHK